MSRTVATSVAVPLSSSGEMPRALGNRYMDPRIVDALDFMQSNCHVSLSVQRMASRAGLSRSRFEHLFNQQTGETFRAALGGFRFAKAAILLTDCSLTVKEIAGMCGYAGSHSFGKAFHRCFGLMPSAYRRSTCGYQIACTDTRS